MNDKVSILVVEDDHAIRGLVEDALSEGGFQVAVADSGEEGLKLLKVDHAHYRAVVTDINLGGELTGWDIGQTAREIDPAMPIIYMTGTHAEEWASKGVPNSVMLTKPFAPAQLVTAIATLLNASPSLPPTG